MHSDILVVIPACNEERTVGAVVRDVRVNVGYDVVVVNDASEDETAQEARNAGATVLNLPWRLGAWGAMQAGIRFALARNYSFVATIDADGQHAPSDIPKILMPIMENQADVVIGSCLARGSALRRFAWSLFRSLTLLNYGDLTSGFRVYGRAAIELLASREATILDYQDVGVLLLLQQAGMRITERPVSMCQRLDGHSRIFDTWFAVGVYMALTGVLSFSKGIGKSAFFNKNSRPRDTAA